MKTVIEDGLVVTPQGEVHGDVLIQGEKIVAVAAGAGDWPSGWASEEGVRRVSAKDKIVLPGGVDGHTHLDMPLADFSSADDFRSGTVAAALGGTTSIVDYAECGARSLREGLEAWMKRAKGKAVVDYGFHMTLKRCDAQVLREMGEMVEAGVTSFKVFTAYPGRMMLPDEDILRVMKRAAELDATVVVHAEDGELIEDLIRRARRDKSTNPIDHALTRPSAGECRAVERVVGMTKESGANVLVAHISAQQAAEEVRRAREEGVSVYGETCPHYLWLEQKKLKDPGLQGASYICAPPLRDVTHMSKLWEGLSRGWLQILGTDHCPFNLRGEKDRGRVPGGGFDFTKVPGGLPGIETRLLLAYVGGVLTGRFDLVRLAEITATNPAKFFGLAPKKGAIVPGADADIAILNPEETTSFDAESLASTVDYSPYHGMRVEGAIETELSRGESSVSNRKFVGKEGRGEYVSCLTVPHVAI